MLSAIVKQFINVYQSSLHTDKHNGLTHTHTQAHTHIYTHHIARQLEYKKYGK